MSAPLVSVVMPVYNAQRHLRETVASLQAQTLGDFELLAVDNGSTDGTPALLEALCAEEPHLRVLHEPVGFAGGARNAGLAAARGKWVIFLDADDLFAPELLATTVAAGEARDAEVVLFGGVCFDDRTDETVGGYDFLVTGLLPEQPVFGRREAGANLLSLGNAAPWTKLYLRDFLLGTGLQFQRIRNYNDWYFTKLSLCLAERITAVPEIPLIRYRTHLTGSLQGTRDAWPTCFADAIAGVGAELRRRGLYEELKPAFLRTAIPGAARGLRSLHTPEARDKALRRMAEEDFRALRLTEQPLAFYAHEPAQVRRAAALLRRTESAWRKQGAAALTGELPLPEEGTLASLGWKVLGRLSQ